MSVKQVGNVALNRQRSMLQTAHMVQLDSNLRLRKRPTKSVGHGNCNHKCNTGAMAFFANTNKKTTSRTVIKVVSTYWSQQDQRNPASQILEIQRTLTSKTNAGYRV